MSQTILITGANRGLGMEHAKQALAAGDTVIATARKPDDAAELQALAGQCGDQLRIEALDTTDHTSIEALAKRLEGVAVDLLMNNAGMAGDQWSENLAAQSLAGMDYAVWRDIFEVNVLGVFKVTSALLPNVLASKRRIVMMMSSDLGSITNNTMGLMHAYRSSKTALNQLTKGLAFELKEQGVTVFSMAPGWVKTDLGGPDGHWEAPDSVRLQREVLAKISAEDSGKFINLKGEEVAW